LYFPQAGLLYLLRDNQRKIKKTKIKKAIDMVKKIIYYVNMY